LNATLAVAFFTWELAGFHAAHPRMPDAQAAENCGMAEQFGLNP
jgi:hypothetical protein